MDGDSVVVKINSTGEYALIRMIGVNTSGYTPALEYTTSKLLGSNVYIVPDGSIKSPVDRWNYMYIYTINNFSYSLIYDGLAKADTSQSNAIFYGDFVEAEKYARNNGLGIWNVNGVYSKDYVFNLAVNINTADKAKLIKYLGIEGGLADAIISHRKSSPFKNIYEIKFVNGMTKAIFDNIRDEITVCTNINKATREEIETLFDVTAKEAEKIVEYQKDHGFSSTNGINSKNFLSGSKYTINKPFISVVDTFELTYANPDYIANVNTADKELLQEAGFSASQSQKIIDYRQYLSFKNMGEIAGVLSLSLKGTNGFADNVSFITDVNNATMNELKTLFRANTSSNARAVYDARDISSMSSLRKIVGDTTFNRIKNYVSVTKSTPSYININTASIQQMQEDAGFTQDQASKLYAKRLNMHTSKDVPLNLVELGFDTKVTLITNVNNASAAELKSLGISAAAVDRIINYRNDQPFGSVDEFTDFLGLLPGHSGLIDTIAEFVCVR